MRLGSSLRKFQQEPASSGRWSQVNGKQEVFRRCFDKLDDEDEDDEGDKDEDEDIRMRMMKMMSNSTIKPTVHK